LPFQSILSYCFVSLKCWYMHSGYFYALLILSSILVFWGFFLFVCFVCLFVCLFNQCKAPVGNWFRLGRYSNSGIIILFYFEHTRRRSFLNASYALNLISTFFILKYHDLNFISDIRHTAGYKKCLNQKS
jgi:hypothetical protein